MDSISVQDTIRNAWINSDVFNEFGFINPVITDNSKKILEKRYLSKDKNGEIIEDIEGMFRRVAHNLSESEFLYFPGDDDRRREVEDKFYLVMRNLEFLPNSPTMMNAGRELQQLSACFVLPVGDSIDEIFESVKQTALIHKSGGGTGFSFSNLRPEGDVVGSTGGIASGPVSFINAFDAATDVVKQGGTRRGANMGILRVDHPDILKFIEAKISGDKLINFNISVGITDEFMEALVKDSTYSLINPKNKIVSGMLYAKEVWDKIVKSAWKIGDPGLVFLDRINEGNPNPQLGNIESTNPCWSGDTKVWTLYGPKTFKELAEIGKDVQVWSRGVEGWEIKWMRNPHLTRKNSKTVKILVRWDQYEYECIVTSDHNLYLMQEEKIKVSELKIGDQLWGIDNHITGYKIPWEVVHIEENIDQDVYNGFVDDNHNYLVTMNNKYLGILSANCGEQPLLPYESCNLGSINLARMVKHDKNQSRISWMRLRKTCYVAVHMLDSVIDMNNYPIEEIAHMSRETRRIGVGVMGWADMLIQLGIRYDSEEALELAREVSKYIRYFVHDASMKLSHDRGVFPQWAESMYKDIKSMRNSAPVTIAPTGTISRIAGVSSGIEPLFAVSYESNVMDNTKLQESHVLYDVLVKSISENYSEEQVSWVNDIFRTSHDISPEWHVKMQAAWQENTDNAVSKTINFPHDTTVYHIDEAYRLAYDLGCKGITIYRDGSRDTQVLNMKRDLGKLKGQIEVSDDFDNEMMFEDMGDTDPRFETDPDSKRIRPKRVTGTTERIKTDHGNMYVTVNSAENYPIEVFSTLGKAGGCDVAMLEAVSRLISLALQFGVTIEAIQSQLRGITCCPIYDNGKQILSVPDGIAQVLEMYMYTEKIKKEIKEEIEDEEKYRLSPDDTCPECTVMLLKGFPERKCHNCGWKELPLLDKIPEIIRDDPWNFYPTPGQEIIYKRDFCPECMSLTWKEEGCIKCPSCGWSKC